MRLLIAGASGRTGRLLVELAAERGHAVTALARNPAHASDAPASVRVVRADVLEPTTLAAAFEGGQDAVVSLLAPRPRVNGRVYIEGTRNLADAAVAAGVRRFVVVSAEGAGINPEAVPLAYRLVLRIPVVAKLYPDIAQMERELEQRTDLDWTVVRPAILTNEPLAGDVRVYEGGAVSGGLHVSRAELAEFLLRVVEDGSYRRERVALAR